jgi:hypothetical protein
MKNQLYAFIAVLAAMFTLSAGVSYADTYAGCTAPTTSTTAHTWYVDPVNGTATGDGSAEFPWKSLNDLIKGQYFANAPAYWDSVKKVMVKANPNGPIKSGDTILLNTGEYGDIEIRGSSGTAAGLIGFNNTDFITIAAAPGQTPHLHSLALLGGTKWVFRGLTITDNDAVAPYRGALFYMGGEYKDIILDNNTLGTTNDTSKWTMKEWNTNVFNAISIHNGSEPYAKCVAITNNKIKNVRFGIGFGSNYTLVKGNSVDYFADDGIDIAGSHLLIENNFITNSVENGDGFHRDGIQGQQLGDQTDVIINQNMVIRQTGDSNPFPGGLQGISSFDGTLSNFTISNNLVITNSPQGIAWYGVKNLTITHNTLLMDNGRAISCPATGGYTACATATVQPTSPWPPTINVSASKTGVHPDNVLVAYNITTHLAIDPLATNVTYTGNICPSIKQGASNICQFALPIGPTKNTVWTNKPGTYGDRNYILP